MNVTDLREELTSHAGDLGAAPDFSPGVARRVRTTKRRRAVATGSVATLAVAALAVGVVTSVGHPAPTVPAGSASSAAPMVGIDGMPHRAVPDAPATSSRTAFATGPGSPTTGWRRVSSATAARGSSRWPGRPRRRTCRSAPSATCPA